MRKLSLVLGTLLVLVAAYSVSPLAASASGTAPAPNAGPHSGARPALATSLSPSRRTPASSVAQYQVTCDGSFNLVASPNGTGNNILVSTSAVSANDVWAVGGSTSSNGYDRTLAEHWNGSTWTVVATPNPGPYHNDLNGVSAISTNNVWAVGSYWINSIGNTRTFAEHWNGTSWTLTTSTVNPNPFFSLLFGVTAISTNDVWAVGTFDSAGLLPLAEHWDGSTWTQVSILNPSPSDNELFAVSAFGTNDVWAVGEYSGNGSGATELKSLAEHWDGVAWTQVTTPNMGTSADNEILGVAALEAGHAVGVGYGDFVAGVTTRKGVAWDLLAVGTSTSQFEVGPGAGDNALLGVARSGSGVWAVGYSRAGATTARQSLVIPATWDSGGPSLTWGAPGTSASPSTINQALYAVGAVTPSLFWATGYQRTATADHTLTELYCGLKLGLAAPATAAAGTPFSVTVTAKNIDNSTNTLYSGRVHFTSSDPQAVLPGDYTFTPGDAGVHTFTGVVLKDPHHQPTTITVNDVATPFVTATASITVSCVGACQSPPGTPGARSGSTQSAGAAAGGRGSTQSPPGAPGPRVPGRSAGATRGARLPAVNPTAEASPETRATTPAATVHPAASVLRANAPVAMVHRTRPVGITAQVFAMAPAARIAPISPVPDPTPWYVMLLLPLVAGGSLVLFRLPIWPGRSVTQAARKASNSSGRRE